jgi:hypothetical protein
MECIPTNALIGIHSIYILTKCTVNKKSSLIYLYFTFYILFTVNTMDKVQQTGGSQWYIPSSKRFRIQFVVQFNIIKLKTQTVTTSY